MISSALVLPFLVLELINQPHSATTFPYALFATLWLLPLAWGWVVTPIAHALATRGSSQVPAIQLVARAIVLMLIAWVWGSIVLDQMPCFLGVPNCD